MRNSNPFLPARTHPLKHTDMRRMETETYNAVNRIPNEVSNQSLQQHQRWLSQVPSNNSSKNNFKRILSSLFSGVRVRQTECENTNSILNVGKRQKKLRAVGETLTHTHTPGDGRPFKLVKRKKQKVFLQQDIGPKKSTQ